MDKEKEIEELKTKLDNFCLDIDNECEIGCSQCLANFLINAGYGNIEQAVREFAEELKKKFDGLNCDEIYFEGDYVDISIVSETLIDQLIKEKFGE